MNSKDLLNKLKKALPGVKFIAGDNFVWSSSNKTVTYKDLNSNQSIWALIHESAHAKLGHKNYASDQHLLKMELEAWQEAKKMAKSLNVTIDPDHIENCLDTYRDWLHNRASCPNCNVVSGQVHSNTYQCFNCQTSWKVPISPLKRIQKVQI